MIFDLAVHPASGRYKLSLHAPLELAETLRLSLLKAGYHSGQIYRTGSPAEPKWRDMYLLNPHASEALLRKQISELLEPLLYGESHNAWALKVRTWAQSLVK